VVENVLANAPETFIVRVSVRQLVLSGHGKSSSEHGSVMI
jgi:hypothetical protein